MEGMRGVAFSLVLVGWVYKELKFTDYIYIYTFPSTIQHDISTYSKIWVSYTSRRNKEARIDKNCQTRSDSGLSSTRSCLEQ